jgi:xylulokinase
MATSGSLVRWFAGIVGDASLDQLDAEAQSTPPGSHGVVCQPYFLGEKSPIHDPSLRGAFVGLHLASTRGDLFRSVLEAVAYGFRHHLDVLAERGVTLGPARVTNGGTRSSLWKQILADVLGVELSPVLGHPGASFGAAIAAGVGTRSVFGWEAIEPLVKLGDPIEPCRQHRARYEQLYEIYRDLEPALRPISHRIAGGEWA